MFSYLLKSSTVPKQETSKFYTYASKQPTTLTFKGLTQTLQLGSSVEMKVFASGRVQLIIDQDANRSIPMAAETAERLLASMVPRKGANK